MKMKQIFFVFVLFLMAQVFPLLADEPRPEALVLNAAGAIDEMGKAPDREKPIQYANDAIAIGIFPSVKKGGYILGGMYGDGVVLYRGMKKKWSYPAFFKIKGGSIGFQAGIQEIDLILFFMTEESFNNFLNRYVNVGINAAAAAGPVGRDLAMNPTDIKKPEEAVFAYSRSKGLYAGVAVTGLKLSYNFKWSKEYYNDAYSELMILKQNEVTNPPKSALTLLDSLNKLEHGDTGK